MKKIAADEFLKKRSGGAIKYIVDVRSPDEHAYKHIPGSVLMPLDELEAHLNEFPRDGDVYVICQSGHRSSQACQRLEGLGLSNAISVDGGINALEKAGGELASFSKVIPLMRQVQIAAGSLMLLSVVLSLFVHPNFIYLSAFVGAGLTFAGLTGFCGMANLLALMPWNKNQNTSMPTKGCCGV